MKEKRTPNSRISVRFKSLGLAKKIKSKKGFTLVELVVVIAIIAVLAAIAIPIVASTTKSSIVSRAKTNANTIEYAFKEADAAVAGADNTIYIHASTNTIQISEVVAANKLERIIKPEHLFGTPYILLSVKARCILQPIQIMTANLMQTTQPLTVQNYPMRLLLFTTKQKGV